MTTTHSDMSVRCGYCEGCDHLTVECPGLRHDNPSTRAFKAMHNRLRATDPSQMLPIPSSPLPYREPRRCFGCKQPEHPGRKLHDSKRLHSTIEWLCGDCMAFRGVPLSKQPVKPPAVIKWHAWQTPAYDGVGGV